jgi:hypothetical protein
MASPFGEIVSGRTTMFAIEGGSVSEPVTSKGTSHLLSPAVMATL